VPDEVVKGLRGRPEETDLVLLGRVPKEVLERSESRIVLPGEVR
jgi:ATP:corrinoid adenosyltransferase